MTNTTTKKGLINISDITVGDVFSEESHYVYEGWNGKTRQFKHLESGKTVNLDDNYVEDLLTTADQFNKEVEIGKEDKVWTAAQIKKGEAPAGTREGDLKLKGIKSIWNDIHTTKVFTVCFTKQGKDLSATQLAKKKEDKAKELEDAIEKAQKMKKGVANAAREALLKILDEPIVSHEPGDERVLRGYKKQFDSINGFYNVMDMDISEQRQVNVNTIKWLVVDGTKYIVK